MERDEVTEAPQPTAAEGWDDDNGDVLDSPLPTSQEPKNVVVAQKPAPAAPSSPARQSKPPVSKIPAPASTQKSTASHHFTLDDANEELSQLVIRGKITNSDVKALKFILEEHVSLKEKVEKLKSLLGRSAKAQREAKMDSEASRKRLLQALREIESLKQKLDKLQTRPSHLELLMDFETNFDKALLSVNPQQQQQSGGQETEDGITDKQLDNAPDSDNLDSMLLQELTEAKTRIDKLETLNNALMGRSNQLEQSYSQLKKERDDAKDGSTKLQMQLRMAQLEADQAQRAMMDK
ncbi:MAG: hypothetical protein SGILL_007801, partial [Bacillariaceae sp.]